MERNEGMRLEGIWKFTFEDVNTGKKRIYEYRNLIPTVARAAIANHLTDVSPSPTSLRINFSAIGSGTNAPANGDTTLQTETFRKAIASQTNLNNVAFATAFYTASEAVGTHKEAGLFLGATATPDSGTLFSRVSITITKANTETLTIDYTITIT